MLGILEMEAGNLNEAQTYLEQAVALSRETGQKPDLAFYLIELSNLSYLQGNLKELRQGVREGLSLRNSFLKLQSVHLLVKILRSLHLHDAQNSARILGIIYKTEREDDILLGRFSKRDYDRYAAYLPRILGRVDIQVRIYGRTEDVVR